MSSDRIFFGSLENQERNRILEERKDDTLSIASATTKASLKTTTAPITHRNEPVLTESLPFSEESQEAKRRHEEMLKKYELQKAARNINVPTNDYDVKMRLRELKQPICYFGEGPAERRERLRSLMAKILIDTGELPQFQKKEAVAQESNVGGGGDDNEYFLYEGPLELKHVRAEITRDSLKQAALRIEHSKIKKITIDPLEEEDLIDAEVKQVVDFDLSMCQYGDSSALSRGAFSQNSEYYATAGGTGQSKVWSIPNCNELTCLNGHLSKVNDIIFNPLLPSLSPSSSGSIATASSDTTVRLWTLNMENSYQESVCLKGHEDRVNRLVFHNLGKYLISTSHDKTWRFWDIETRQELLVQTGHAKPVYTAALHPDGSLLFTGDLGGTGMIWDLRIGRAIMPIIGHIKQILCSDFNRNGYHLATGSDDNTVRLWDIRRKNCFYILPAHLKLISDIKFQPEKSRYLITSSYDNTCKIWSSKDWSLVKTLQGHESKVTSVSMSYDLKYIATTSMDRKWMLWNHNEQAISNKMIIE